MMIIHSLIFVKGGEARFHVKCNFSASHQECVWLAESDSDIKLFTINKARNQQLSSDCKLAATARPRQPRSTEVRVNRRGCGGGGGNLHLGTYDRQLLGGSRVYVYLKCGSCLMKWNAMTAKCRHDIMHNTAGGGRHPRCLVDGCPAPSLLRHGAGSSEPTSSS